MSRVVRLSSPDRPVQLVGQTVGRFKVQVDFNSRGFAAHLLGVNIYRALRLREDQYPSFLNLLVQIKAHVISKNYVVDKLLPLELPPLDELRSIDFAALLTRPVALAEVMSRCVMPQGKYIVDLSVLPEIYRLYNT